MHFQKTNLIFVVFIFLLASACATPIRKIYKSPDKYHDKKIIVKGVVISSLELIDLFSFTLKDKSGKIMVVTENLLPLKNDRIRVHGIIDKNFSYKEQNIIVIKEKKMKQQKLNDARKKINKL
jgi:hypothetical protein